MAEVFDYITDENDDLLIKDGDFVIAESTQKHQRHILLMSPGNCFYEPFAGVSIGDYMLDDISFDELKGDIQMEFEADGMQIKSLKVESLDNIQIEAAY